jgi:hypothetical protein
VGVQQAQPDGQESRLTPEMRSRKLQALDFVKRYFARWGQSPTLGELAASLDVSRKRAHALVHELADDHMVEVTAGKARGMRLMDHSEELSEADILLLLRARGWTIGRDTVLILPPNSPEEALVGAAIAQGVTEKGLHALPLLDHDARLEGQSGATLANFAGPPPKTGAGKYGEIDQKRAGARAAAPARRAATGKPSSLGKAAS